MSALAFARDDCELDALEYFRNGLPHRPRCTDDLKYGTFIRGRAFATTQRYIQPNPPCRAVWLVFDVDQPDGATGWYDRSAPAPTLSVQNPDSPGSPGNGHAHLLYGLRTPVTTTDAARRKPLLYLAAVQEGLRRKLDADPGYAGLIVKNPVNFIESWQVRRWAGLYDLGELADWVDLPSPAAMKKRIRDQDYAGLGRNCRLFEELRVVAYGLVRSYWRPGGLEDFLGALVSIANGKNSAFGVALPEQEVRAIAKSTGRWVWKHFTPAGFRSVQSARGRRKGGARRAEMLSRAQALADIGCSQRRMARELGVPRKTIAGWLGRP